MNKNLDYSVYGIYELRKIGRLKGVKTPTRYKKDELIQQILLLDQGKIAPYKSKTKQGRPAKEISLNKILYYNCSQCPVFKNMKLILKEIKNILNKY